MLYLCYNALPHLSLKQKLGKDFISYKTKINCILGLGGGIELMYKFT